MAQPSLDFKDDLVAKRLRIPRLVPSGSRAKLATYVQPRPRASRSVYSADDKKRLEAEPWRADGYGRQYRKQRQRVIERQGGRCSVCGRKVAEKTPSGHWSCARLGGQVHHDKPLRSGGTSDVGNLTLVCPSCHACLDAALRRAEGSGKSL